MMNHLLLPAIAVMLLSSCTHTSYTVASTNRVQDTMREVDKTDFAKIDSHRKDKIESNRQDRYHSYANDADKKLNHQKNEQINKKKSPNTEFTFY